VWPEQSAMRPLKRGSYETQELVSRAGACPGGGAAFDSIGVPAAAQASPEEAKGVGMKPPWTLRPLVTPDMTRNAGGK
jgi:hypothetical protein